MSLTFPDGYTALTPITGTEKIMAARLSDGKMFYINLSDITAAYISTGTLTSTLANYVTGAGLTNTLASYQPTLKTINGVALAGTGNISVLADVTKVVGLPVVNIDNGNIGLTGDIATNRVINPFTVTTNANFTATVIPQEANTADGYVKSFFMRTGSGIAGNQIEFYVLGWDGAKYTVKYASGLINAATSITMFTFVPPPFAAKILTGDFIGCFSSGAAVGGLSNLNYPTYSMSLITPVARLTVGSSYSSSTVLPYAVSVSAEIQPTILIPTLASKDIEGGYPQLGLNGKLKPKYLPELIGGTVAEIRNSTASEMVTEGSSNLVISRAKSTVVTNSIGDITQTTSIGNGGNLIYIPYDNTAPGFSVAGTLKTLRLPPLNTAVAGNVIQAWVVRPIDLTKGKFSIVHTIGSILCEVTLRKIEFRDLFLPVKAGDMIALSSTNVLTVVVSSTFSITSANRTNPIASADPSVKFNADIAASPVTPAITAIYPPYQVEILQGSSFFATNQPSSLQALGSDGFIPPTIARKIRSPWAGKNIIWAGTSIPAGGGATIPSNSYVNIIIGTLGAATVTNVSVPSSGIVGSSYAGLSNTIAQSADPSFSYQTKIIGKNADLLIIEHGYNDRAKTIGTIDSLDNNTVYGAFNVVIQAYFADKPDGRMMLVTPPSKYSYAKATTGQVAGVDKALIEGVANAIVAIGAKYTIPVLDLSNLGPFNIYNHASYFVDGIHPNDLGHKILSEWEFAFLMNR